MSMDRFAHALREPLSRFFQTADFTIAPLPGGASSRRYYKITFSGDASYFPAPAVLLTVIPPEEPAVLTDYVNIAYYLKRTGVPIPALYEINCAEGWVFSEYLELPTLEEHLRRSPQGIEKVLPEVLQFLLEIQHRCAFEAHCPAFQRRFDYQKYMFEFDFHLREQLLNFYYQHHYDSAVLQDFSHRISAALDIDLPVFVHRDFQSSNIFYDSAAPTSRFKIIDFQDARRGSPLYDLVSCLWDSYIPIGEELREELLKEYFRHLPELSIEWEWKYFEKIADYTVIQRKLHDAGAFAYNFRRFGSKRYVGFIETAVEMALAKMWKYREFAHACKIFER